MSNERRNIQQNQSAVKRSAERNRGVAGELGERTFNRRGTVFEKFRKQVNAIFYVGSRKVSNCF